MTDRRPLGTGPLSADLSRTRATDPAAPRAQLAAERLQAVPAAVPRAARPAGRRRLGGGTTPAAEPDEPNASRTGA